MSNPWNVLSVGQWQKYVRTICKRANLSLKWSDEGRCATDGKTIWVPTPTWPLTETNAAVNLSAVIHEASHVTHSDFVEGERVLTKNPATFILWNIIEDDRIEAIPSKEFAGDRASFIKSAPSIVDGWAANRVEMIPTLTGEERSLQEKLFAVGLWNCAERARTWAPAYTVDPKHVIPSAVQAHIDTLNAHPDVRAALDAARYDDSMNGSRAMVRLAERITDLLKITKEEQEEAGKAQAGGMGQQGAGADGGQHEGMAKEIGAGEKGAAQKAMEGTAQPGDEAKADPREMYSHTRGVGQYQPIDPAEYISETLDAEADTTCRDGTAQEVGRLRSSQSDLNGITNRVRRLLQIASQTLRTYGHKSGKLHGASLYRLGLKTAESKRVFRKDETQLDLDVAVFVLMDASGSMGNKGKMANAIIATETLSTCIGNVLGAPVMVGSFSTKHDRVRDGDTPHHIISRRFTERMVHPDKMTERLCGAASRQGHNNNDGESIAWAVDELRAVRAKRKYLIVLSDGMPSARNYGDLSAHLKEVIQAAEAVPGLEVHAIGIMADHVREYYTHATVLRKPEDLGECIMNLIGERLLKTGKRS